MADQWSNDEHAAEVAQQADIAANIVPEDAGQADPAPETIDEPVAVPEDAEQVEIVLAADATAADENGEQVPVNEVSIAGVVLKPGEPVAVDAAVARALVTSEDNVEVAA